MGKAAVGGTAEGLDAGSADIEHLLRPSVTLVSEGGSALVPTRVGTFEGHVFTSLVDGLEHLALVLGDVAGDDVVTRVHSECLTGDVFGSRRCDCGAQLEMSLERIADEGRGVVVYLRGHEGRGIGLAEKLRAYRLQDEGLDTIEANLELGYAADERHYGVAAQVLSHLGVASVVLLTNNPAKVGGLVELGVRVVGRLPLWSEPTAENERYLSTKRSRLGHLAPDAP
ncbi:MAG: GTP cyclohydrolase II [Acidimicrobiales bacterium]|nr:GTP cyclohydrolase II [Acidimicrobiales bacterium]